ncbi:MAG: 50S ribosomal protein L10 [Candidatus Micrarchaeota archaeon]
MAYKVDTKRKEIMKKTAKVADTIARMKKYKTVALLALTKLPDALFQSLRKNVRDNGGEVLVLKKAVISRVLSTNPKLKERVGECSRPVALILTNQSPYELNSFFKSNKKKRAAKIGDTAVADIVIPEGETDLPPGPALSELKAGGVNVQIKGGKIVVSKESTIAKSGEKLTEPKVKALQSLGVQPFEITANLVFGYDGQYIFSKEILDIGDTISADVSAGLGQGLNLSLNISYPTGQNIEILLGHAFRQARDASFNGSLYSSSSIELLLSSAARQGMALEGMSKG